MVQYVISYFSWQPLLFKNDEVKPHCNYSFAKYDTFIERTVAWKGSLLLNILFVFASFLVQFQLRTRKIMQKMFDMPNRKSTSICIYSGFYRLCQTVMSFLEGNSLAIQTQKNYDATRVRIFGLRKKTFSNTLIRCRARGIAVFLTRYTFCCHLSPSQTALRDEYPQITFFYDPHGASESPKNSTLWLDKFLTPKIKKLTWSNLHTFATTIAHFSSNSVPTN